MEKPVVGGDTMFCNMARAYDDLSDKMKAASRATFHSVYDFNMVSGDPKSRTNDNTVAGSTGSTRPSGIQLCACTMRAV